MGKGGKLTVTVQEEEDNPELKEDQLPHFVDPKTRKITKKLHRHRDEVTEATRLPQGIQQIQSRRPQHLAVCFPDSIVAHMQTSQLRAYFVSQIARMLAMHRVDEIIILRDHSYTALSSAFSPPEYLARNLQYLETPQYLRKYLFKMHPDLKNAGLMNPIETHHHLKADEVCQFREGVSLDRPSKASRGSWIDVGLRQQVLLNTLLPPNTRVTVRLHNYQNQLQSTLQGEAVSKKAPCQQKGLYWGYEVRIAKNLKEVIKGGNYDTKFLCGQLLQDEILPTVKSFKGLDLNGQSVLLMFTGTDDLNNFIYSDKRSKVTSKQVKAKFDYFFTYGGGFGVSALRVEEQLFRCLSLLWRQ